MKIWLSSFLLLFALANFVLWLKNFFIPLPLYIFGGVMIAIASNYHLNWGFKEQISELKQLEINEKSR